ncbi:MAG: hypothetical protein ACRDKJ_00865, partial [Actinomycetota bacterium]
LIECDVFFNFVRPASIAGRGLNVSSFLGAIQRLGRQPSNAYSAFDYTNHIDGISEVAYLEYGADCDCMRYTKGRIPVS